MSSSTTQPLDLEAIRAQFPILGTTVRGRPLVYLDNAATSHKPLAVPRAEAEFYATSNANVHRGVHLLAERATQAYEDSRAAVARFLGGAPEEVVFVRGATEGINLVAHGHARALLSRGDEVVVSALEHHANLIPWQEACAAAGATLRVIPCDDAGVLDLDAYRALLGPRTRLVAVTWVSNALGTVVPLRGIIDAAHAVGARVLVDACQAVPHLPVDVRALGADYLVFSGHKVYGPTGIGVLWGTPAALAALPPWQTGGDMIEVVTYEKATYREPPGRFEAGTPNMAGAVGLAAALAWVEAIGRPAIAAHEHALVERIVAALRAIPGVTLVGTPPERAGVVSFVVDGIHPHDLGTALDGHGIAVRAGHHCAQPLLRRLKRPATVRASVAVYNTPAEIDRLAEGILAAQRFFGP